MSELGGQMSLDSFRERFDDQLTCSVCLDQYTNPKTLPCHHSFCLKCIEPLPVEIKNAKHYISCPTCRIHHRLPQGTVNSLPNAFHLNSLLDLRHKLASSAPNAATSNRSQSTNVPNQSNCPKHNDALKVYCETCNQVICRDCTISSEHNKHAFYLISECYPKHHQQIQDNIDLVKHKLDAIDTSMTHLDTREIQVFQQGEIVKEQINTQAQQLIDSIQQSRIHLIHEVDTIVQRKAQTLAAQREQAKKLRTQLKTCQDMIEDSLKVWCQQQILAQKHALIYEMKIATQHIDPAVYNPIEDANIHYIKGMKELGAITKVSYAGITLEVAPCTVKQPSRATLTLLSHGSPFSLPPSFISCTLSSPDNKHSENCSVSLDTQVGVGKYNITFTPSTRNDKLIVQIGGFEVLNSPFFLPVIPSLNTRGEPIRIKSDLNIPWGIAVRGDGSAVLTERGGHCSLTILNIKGEKEKTLENIYTNPRGVCFSTDGHILVTDDHRLRKLTTDGGCVTSIGGVNSGRGHLELHYPQGIAVDHITGQVFVADCYNNRIQVFNNDLTFSHTITPSILSPQFNHPYDIAIDNEGRYFYVTDSGNNCITKLDSRGKYIKKFSSKGSENGQLSHPTFLTIHNNFLYVSDSGNNCVSVFDTDGKFHHQFGEDILKCPHGIAMDMLGNLYVCDTDNNQITVF